ncbi:MAG: YIP1 family protein [Epulopiscium sp.]|nr:YIP1 family protein [Candidatus Epulonipiscium sp.]
MRAMMEKTESLNQSKLQNLLKSLKFSLHVIVRPFDGFWDLIHEKRGSIGAANIIFIMVLITNVLKMQFTSFLFYRIQLEYVNMFKVLLGIIVPFGIWCVSNWSLTTLMDGKGSLKDIYMATAYAFTPYVLINLPMTVISNLITLEEGAFYQYFIAFAMLWCIFLILCAMMMIHDYSMGKAIFSSLLTIVGMGVIIFLTLLFFSLISDGIGYLISLYKEIVFRFY